METNKPTSLTEEPLETVYHYLKTNSHQTFTYDIVRPNSIRLNDIVHALGHINRYNGHTNEPYSVAEHTLLCYFLAEEQGYSNRELLLVLMHDFTEAYVGDCPSPLKRLLPNFKEIEHRVQVGIHEALNVPLPSEEEYQKVLAVDMTALYLEMRDLDVEDVATFYHPSLIDSVTTDTSWNVKTNPNKKLFTTLLRELTTELLQELERTT